MSSLTLSDGRRFNTLSVYTLSCLCTYKIDFLFYAVTKATIRFERPFRAPNMEPNERRYFCFSLTHCRLRTEPRCKDKPESAHVLFLLIVSFDNIKTFQKMFAEINKNKISIFRLDFFIFTYLIINDKKRQIVRYAKLKKNKSSIMPT